MKYLLLILFVLFSLMVALRIAGSSSRVVEDHPVPGRIPAYSLGEMSDIYAREAELNEEQRRIQLYLKNLAATLSRLREERISLRSAAAALDVQARECHPHLHPALEKRYASLSSLERMALRLLQHLEEDGCPSEVVERLSRDMSKWSKVDPALFRQPVQGRLH